MLYIALGFVVYFPILDNAFISDDYDSLYRIQIEKTVIIKEFFRPMIDWSFYLNFLMSGFNPWSYYLCNIIIHIFNAYLVFQVVLNYGSYTKTNPQFLPFLCGLLFLMYPFHNEGIIWLTGRLASIASMFALLSINVMLLPLKRSVKISMAVIFYFAGLTAYESILFLPLIIIVMLWDASKRIKSVMKEIGCALIVIATYLIIRQILSGAIYGAYGERMVDDWSIKGNITKSLKVLGRSILPPLENSNLLTVFFAVAIYLLAIVHWLGRKAKAYTLSFRNNSIKLAVAFIIAMVIPVFFGISTRTTEGDRLLYFPSIFGVILLANYLLLFSQRISRNVAFCLVGGYFLFFLLMNIQQWEKASSASDDIIKKVIKNHDKGIVLINLPDELEGAYVFRNGFYKALLLNKIDTSRVKVNNYLMRLDYLEIDRAIKIDSSLPSYEIPPVTKIIQTPSLDSIIIVNTKENTRMVIKRDDFVLYFWDKYTLQRIDN